MTDEASPKPKKRKKKRPADETIAEAVAPAKAGARTPGGEDAAAYAEGKKWTAAAAVLLLVGVGLVATGEQNIGPLATVAGMATAIWGAHRLGRSGPDGAATLAPPRSCLLSSRRSSASRSAPRSRGQPDASFRITAAPCGPHGAS